MTTPPDYTALITSEHADKPLFVATIEALTQAFRDGIIEAATLPADFDLDTAAGDQLDAVGLWVGIKRQLATPITGVYFEWDGATSLTGWGSGVWQGLYDPSSGLTSLPDDEYRRLIRAKIAANHWDGTVQHAEEVWDQVFQSDATAQRVLLQDFQDMSMLVSFVGPPLTAIQQALLIGGYFPLKCAGVRIRNYSLSINPGPVFAWDVANGTTLDGWGVGSWTQEISPP